jgi:hypothetical protein
MPDTPNPTNPIELKLENGMVIKGDNAEEALKSAAKIIEDNVRSYRETKAQLDTLQNQFQTFQQQQQKPPEPPNGWSNEKYYQLLNQDAALAQDYWFEHRTGQKIGDVMDTFANIQAKVDEFRGSMLAANFANAHPDFPGDTETANTLTGRIRQLTGQGHPTDQHTMDMAWTQLLAEGKVKPLEAEQQQEELPPTPGGSGGYMSDAELRKAEQLPDKELYALLKSKGMV